MDFVIWRGWHFLELPFHSTCKCNVPNHHGNPCRVTGTIVGHLEGLAEEIGGELDRQNELIPKINEKVHKVSGDIEAVSDHLHSHLK